MKIGIAGYGNLGRSVELGIRQNSDMELAAVFTRRDPSSVRLLTEDVAVHPVDRAADMQNGIDVMILCGGSKSDLPEQGPRFAGMFHTVDAYDTHTKIPQYFDAMDRAAKSSGHVCVISSGWDPGMFSLNRLLANVILPVGRDYTFWGRGVSQGHSDAIRRVKGVKNAKQYTIPVELAVESVRNGENPDLTARQKHVRECFVVTEDSADRAAIEAEIRSMPDYFADYDTTVHFITEEDFNKNHSGIPHGGFVIRSGRTGQNGENTHIIEYSLKLESNPDFTANVLLAYARAVYRLSREGVTGAKTVFDIAPAYLAIQSGEELRRNML